MPMRWSVLALLGCLLLVSPSVLAGPQDIAAKRLFNEAVKLTDRAEAEGDGMRRRDLLRDAFARLERIVDEYPDSELAVKLISIGSTRLSCASACARPSWRRTFSRSPATPPRRRRRSRRRRPSRC